MALNKKQLAAFTLLSASIAAAEARFVYAKESDVAAFVKENLVEVNATMTDENGNVAVRLVDGQDAETAAANAAAASAAASAPRSSSAFVIEDGIPAPEGSGRGRSSEMYPFDKLEVGQSFFVPVSEKKPNPAKSLASTVSSATARYAEEIEGEFRTNNKGVQVPKTRETRKFIVREVDETAQGRGPGARVWRTA